MQKKDFLYFLTDKDGRCYKLDDQGNVFIDLTVKPLANTPDGWQDKMIEYARNTKYYGMVRTFTVPLKFVTDGAKIVRFLYYTYGIQAECYLRIAKLNWKTGNHEKYYVGALDFSTFSDEVEFVEVSILDSGLASLIKANEGTTYEIPIGTDTTDEIPITEDPSLNVLLDGITLKGNMDYVSLALQHENGWHFPDQVFVQKDGTFSNLDNQDVDFQGLAVADIINDPPSIIQNSDHWVIKATAAAKITINLEYDIDVADAQAPTPKKSHAQIWVGTSSGYGYGTISTSMIGGNLGAFINYTGHATLNINLAAGEKLYIYTQVNQEDTLSAGKVKIKYNTFDLTITGLTRYNPTYCKALRPSFIFERLVHKLSNLTDNIKSDLLEANNGQNLYSVLITSGDAIRGLDAKIKTNFGDFFKAMNCIWNVGFGIENETGVLEKKEYFYTGDILTTIEDGSNLTVTPAVDYINNKIEVGYEADTYDDINGKDEFNNTSEFSTPITRVTNALDLVSPYRADMYGIEFIRIKNQGQDTADTSNDDTIFLLVVESTPTTDPDSGKEYYKLYRGPFIMGQGPTITGVISAETAFNYEISPKHNLIRHENFIHGFLDKLDAQSIKFQTTDKNDQFSITYPGFLGTPGSTVTENTDVVIGNMAPKLFLPYIFEFDTEIPEGVKNIFDENPKGKIKFNWEGNYYTGFILECGIKPSWKESQNWKLLAAPENDMTKLINNG